MTQSGYTSAVVDAMLSWLKGLASWFLKLFNLSGGFSPLKFLADNWKQLLIILLIVGVVVDLLVWLLRWRPHWIWFRKKRVIINDKNFFSGKNDVDNRAKQRTKSGVNAAEIRKPKEDWQDSEYVVYGKDRRKRMEQAKKATQRPVKNKNEHTDVFSDDLFNVKAKQRFSDRYEDEVFNVSSLPEKEQAEQEFVRADRNNENAPRKKTGKNAKRRQR
ncbi:MAG: hypothetical protein IJA26_00820 [Clostridia bacterium]|nr:hypothetical protein [Clostridia bacterium]